MKNFLARRVSKFATCLLLGVLVFPSCHQDETAVFQKVNTIDTSDPLYLYITNDLGFNPDDIEGYEDMYVAEGDIMFNKQTFNLPSNPDARVAQSTALPIVQSPKDITVSINSNMPSSGVENWRTEIQSAINAWNGVTCSGLRFRLVTSNSKIDIQHDNGTLPDLGANGNRELARGEFPSAAGQAGKKILVNVSLSSSINSNIKVATIMHELGHNVGFRHTNWKNRGESASPLGVHLVPGTTETDNNSIMNTAAGNPMFSDNDLVAIRNVYPELSTSCLAPFYRYYSSSASNHFYTMNFGELGAGRNGFAFTWIECHLYGAQKSGTVPLYRYYSSSKKDHLYTTTFIDRDGYNYERIAGYIFTSSANGRLPLYGYRHSSGTDHVYTVDFNELGNGALGYVYEGITGYVLP